MISMVFAYSYIKQPTTEEKPYDNSINFVNNKDISVEIDNQLIDENYKVEIGEMVLNLSHLFSFH
jgi:hypothetical protein